MGTIHKEFTVGADPEVMLADMRGFLSAHDAVPGTKEKPHKLANCEVQRDGVAVEFNVKPASTPEEFEHNVTAAINDVKAVIPEGTFLVPRPFTFISKRYFDTIPEEAKVLGCAPFMNAAKNETVEPINREKITTQYYDGKPWAAFGGHLHVGWGSGFDPNDALHIADACDYAIHAQHVLREYIRACKSPQCTSPKRDKVYGNGCPIRVKPYGVELRKPSNIWLRYPKAYGNIFRILEVVYDHMMDGKTITMESQAYYKDSGVDSERVAKRLNFIYGKYGIEFTPEMFEHDLLEGL